MIEVKLHDIGEGMTEGEILNYFVKEGDKVKADDPLVEVQTDKMVAEIPSPADGVIKEIVIPVGETVEVGTTLIYLDTENKVEVKMEEVPKKGKIEFEINEEREIVSKKPKRKLTRVLATPYTRKIARDHQIDIEKVPPSDPSGRVTEEDVYRYIEQQNLQTAVATEAMATNRMQAVQTEEKVTTAQVTAESTVAVDEVIPFRGIRKEIAQKMTKSLFTIPHVTHFDEIDMTNLFELREKLKEEGISVSVPAFLVKALVFALKDYPIFNALLDEENEQIILKKEYHIGMATDTENGLLVPVLRDADKKSLLTIHKELKQLTQKAKEGKLMLEEMKNSTFTVSNVGPLGSIAATPIINYPETALIAFHKTKKTPVVNEQDEIVIRQMMTLSMSFDHRVADGATAIAFTNRLAQLIENPYNLMLEMI